MLIISFNIKGIVHKEFVLVAQTVNYVYNCDVLRKMRESVWRFLTTWVKPTILPKVEVTLRLTVSQLLCLGIEHPSGTCDQILLPVGMFLSEICGLVSLGRPLWREDGSAICSLITQQSESLRTRNHTLLSHLRLPPTWRARFPYLYPLGTGWPSYTPEYWATILPHYSKTNVEIVTLLN
jgi:hypothetical protein